MMSRFVQFKGLVCFFCGNISISNGSRISHSESVKLLEYGIVTVLEDGDDLTSSQQKMSNGFYTLTENALQKAETLACWNQNLTSIFVDTCLKFMV